MMGSTREKMQVMALMLREHINQSEAGITEPALVQHVQALGEQTSYRFTLINSDGIVLADSETGDRDIGSHSDRPEFVEAGGRVGRGRARRPTTSDLEESRRNGSCGDPCSFD